MLSFSRNKGFIPLLRGKYLPQFCWTNFHFGEKAKAMRLQRITVILFTIYLSFIKCRDDGDPLTPPPVTLHYEHVQNSFAQGD